MLNIFEWYFLNNIFKNSNDRWAYPSVMTYTDEFKGKGADAEAAKIAHEFIRDYAPKFMKILGAKDRENTTELRIGS